MKGEIIEVILILIIIGIQSYIFYEVFNKIKIYKYILNFYFSFYNIWDAFLTTRL